MSPTSSDEANPSNEVVEAVVAFLRTKTWKDARVVLEAHAEHLPSADAGAVVRALIVDGACGDGHDYLRTALKLLETRLSTKRIFCRLLRLHPRTLSNPSPRFDAWLEQPLSAEDLEALTVLAGPFNESMQRLLERGLVTAAESDGAGATMPRPMLSRDNHYIILVHGTFARPVKGKPHWCLYDASDEKGFAARLDRALAGTPLEGAVERTARVISELGADIGAFTWLAGNTHAERRQGGYDLYELLEAIVDYDQNARIHCVAHSHGGNVLLLAVQAYFATLRYTAQRYVVSAVLGYFADPATLDKASRALRGLYRDRRIDLYFRRVAERIRSSELARSNDWTRELFSATISRRVRRAAAVRGVPPDVIRQELAQKMNEQRRDAHPGWFEEDSPYPEDERLVGALLSSPVSNRLGRLVFLGTPFFLKRWRRGHPLKEAFARAGTLLTLIAVATLFGYGVGAVVLYGLNLVLGTSFAVLNPLRWPPAALVLLLLWVLRLRGNWGTGETRNDGNIYFNHMRAEAIPVPSVMSAYGLPGYADGRISAMVLTSSAMDEALLGLSADPFVLGVVGGRLDQFVIPERRSTPGSGKFPSGVHRTQGAATRRFLRGLGRNLVRQTLGRIYEVVFAPVFRVAFRYLVQPLLLRTIQGVLDTAGKGMVVEETRDAIIDTSAVPGLDNIFRTTVCDLTELLGERFEHGERTPERTSDAQPDEDEGGSMLSCVASRFRFMYDDDELATRMAGDTRWQSLSDEIPRLADMYERPDEEAFRRDLARKWFGARERIAQLGELTHSQYYGTPEVVDKIASFLVSGEAEV